MMKKRMTKAGLGTALISAALALAAMLLTDAVVVFLGGELSVAAAAVLTAILAVLLYLPCRKWKKGMLLGACGILAVLILLGAVLCGGWRSFSRDAQYQFSDDGKGSLYADRRVMLVVPHQDDDLNILGGVLEEYVRYGSELYAVFLTNGDYAGLTQTRYLEALTVFSDMGVPQDHVIFLGYGNEWQGTHIYNAEFGTVVTSHIGKTQTYGTQMHPAYREGREYTIDNLTEDLRSVIQDYKPDVLFCSDYDHHIDHKATTLLFDKVMGGILKEDPAYRPVVYKAYAYGTAWEADADYYADNVRSTRDPFAEPYSQYPAVYRWADRVRFPVDGSMLSRSLVASGAYEQLKGYTSQGAQWHAAGIVNGDKVAWQRRTDSLCLTADVSASSGNAALLHDFMIIENRDLADGEHLPYDGVWIPENSDGERTVAVTLDSPADLHSVVLYDHPAPDQNVKNVRITFEDGTVLETGPQDPAGAATPVAVGKTGVSAFRVTLLETEGELAGLSELEAFLEEKQPDGRLLKLTDNEGNFLYDYLLPAQGSAELTVYTQGGFSEGKDFDYVIHTDGGTAVLENGVIRVTCPAGQSFRLTVSCPETGLSDSIYIRNPGSVSRMWTAFWQCLEESVYAFFAEQGPEKLLPVRLYDKISYKLRHGL